MATGQFDIVLPLMGEGVHQATIVKWLKQPGDTIEKDEPVVEVSTDKVDTEVASPVGGVLSKQVANEGDEVEVNQIIGVLETDAAPAAAAGPSSSASRDSAEKPADTVPPKTQQPQTPNNVSEKKSPTLSSAPKTGPVKSSPIVRKMAKDERIDLRRVTGSGLGGRITKRDLEAVIEQGGVFDASPLQAHSAAPESVGLVTKVTDGEEFLEGVKVRREAMSKMRRLTAEHMLQSVRTSPHVTTVFEVDLNKIVNIRDKHKASFKNTEGFGLTYTHFLIHATVKAIKKHPIMNVSVDGTDILFKDDINIGCAVAVPKGLIVPVVKKAGDLSLLGITRRFNDLVTRARAGRLKPDDVTGGTFTITNPGGYGSITSNPIINQPQVAILGIGAIVKRPVVVEGDAIAVRPTMMISITFDHRVIDGEGGALFLKSLKEILENYSEEPI